MLVLALLAVAMLSLIGLEGFRYARTLQDLQAGRDILTETADLLEERGLDATESDLKLADAGFGRAGKRLDRATGILQSDPVLFVAKRLPWLGDQINTAHALADIGSDSAAIGKESVEALRSYQRIRDSQGEGELSERVVSVLDALDPHLTSIEDQLAAVQQKRSHIADGGLMSALDSAVSSLDQRMEDLEERLANQRRAQEMAPMVLGYEGPQTYLVLAHDNTEILATGGFILVYGFLTLDQGKLQHLSFENVVNVPDGEWPPTNDRPYVEPPRALKLHLLRNWPMGLAEASWWPDFPTAAQMAIEIYRVNSNDHRTIDGVMGINFLTLEKLLEVLGPVTVEVYNETVSSETVTNRTLIITHPEELRPWETDRYDFTSYVTEEVIRRTLSADSSHWGSLLEALGALGHEKNLLMYHTDPAVQRAIVGLGWDGSIAENDGDFLMAVDSNLRRNKLNLVVKTGIDLDVHLDAAGNATNAVAITYRNDHSSWSRTADPRLLPLMTGGGWPVPLYGSYMRLLVPGASELQALTVGGVPAEVEEISTEGARDSFGFYVSVPLDSTAEITYEYVVPSVADDSHNPYEYRLFVQKQPGTKSIPLRVRVEAPPAMRIVSMLLDGKELE
ncbi:MAG: DUF4012 domain-containing protein, partial [Dehalococcoidia bacterium]